MVWVIELSYEIERIEVADEFANDLQPVSWSTIEQNLSGFERIDTGVIYSDEHQTSKIPSKNYVIKGTFEDGTDDDQILAALNWAMEENLPKDKTIYLRVYPEIVKRDGSKHLYSRFVVKL